MLFLLLLARVRNLEQPATARDSLQLAIAPLRLLVRLLLVFSSIWEGVAVTFTGLLFTAPACMQPRYTCLS